MTTHMGCFRLCHIGEGRVVFWHRQGIHVCTKHDTATFSFLILLNIGSAIDVEDHTGTCQGFDIFLIYSVGYKSLLDFSMGLKFNEGCFCILVYVMSDINHSV